MQQGTNLVVKIFWGGFGVARWEEIFDSNPTICAFSLRFVRSGFCGMLGCKLMACVVEMLFRSQHRGACPSRGPAAFSPICIWAPRSAAETNLFPSGTFGTSIVSVLHSR